MQTFPDFFFQPLKGLEEKEKGGGIPNRRRERLG
jgi:hypothetical protein